MIAENLINHLIPSLKKTDSAQKAIVWMEELRTHQLPVIENGQFQGLISEEIIIENNDINKIVSDYTLLAPDSHVFYYQHYFDIIKVANLNKVDIVAVLDDEMKFQGVVSLTDTLTALASTSAIQGSGGILVMAMNQVDYSMAELSRLIEAENAKITSSFVSYDHDNPARIMVTLKINKTDLSVIVATLERFNYNIVAKFQSPEAFTNEKERIDALLRYLSI